jgi:peptide deformylase
MIRAIIKGNDPRLTSVSRQVSSTDSDALQDLIDTYEDRMRGTAIGLAAVQIGHMVRACVVRCNGSPFLMLNPVVLQASIDNETAEERCLSFPWLTGVMVMRPRDGIVRYWDKWFDQHQLSLRGLEFRCLLHEIDHMNGITIDMLRRVPKNAQP